MDILAAIFTYLGCVTGIVCAFALSFALYLSPHSHSASVAHGGTVAAVASATQAPATTIAQSVLLLKTEPKVAQAAPAPNNEPAAVALADPAAAAPSKAAVLFDQSLTRRKALASRAQTYRRVVEEQRTKRLAYQQDPDFEARFLGYAN